MIPIEKITTQPFHLRAPIPEDYMDMFGHMNIQYYFKLFNDSIFILMDTFQMDSAYFEAHNRAMWAIEQHIKYLAEVHAGQTVAVYSRILARADKRMHFMKFMVNESTGKLAATLEVLAFHIDRSVRRSSPFPDHVAAAIDERVVRDWQLDWDVPLCAPMGV